MNRKTERIVDEFLVIRCQAGDTEALRLLIERYQSELIRYARVVTRNGDLANDVVQDAWIKILKHLPNLNDASSFPAWSHRIVNNRALDLLRKQRPTVNEIPEQSSSPISEIEAHQDAQVLLNHLSAEHRAVMALHYLQGFELAEIATIIGKPLGTVKSRLHHARSKFRTLLAEQDNPGEHNNE